MPALKLLNEGVSNSGAGTRWSGRGTCRERGPQGGHLTSKDREDARTEGQITRTPEKGPKENLEWGRRGNHKETQSKTSPFSKGRAACWGKEQPGTNLLSGDYRPRPPLLRLSDHQGASSFLLSAPYRHWIVCTRPSSYADAAQGRRHAAPEGIARPACSRALLL